MQIELEDLRRIQVRPGDRFVYQSRVPLTQLEADRIRARWLQVFPDNELVVVFGASLSVVGCAPDNSPDAVVDRYREHPDGLAAIGERRAGG